MSIHCCREGLPRRAFYCRPRCAVALVAMLALGGCQAGDADNETLGTLLGSVSGAVLGAQVGSGVSRVVASAVGAVGGALVGREIARWLNQRDQEQVAASTQEAIQTGESQTWSNPESGASGSVTARDAGQRSGATSVQVQRDRVDEIPPLDMIGASYVATSSVNVRGGPGTDFRRVGGLAEGERVHVVGRVQKSDWLLIAQGGGAANGFVSQGLLRPAPAETIMVAAPAASAGVTTTTVEATRQCREVEQTIVLADGRQEREAYTVCMGPNGPERIDV